MFPAKSLRKKPLMLRLFLWCSVAIRLRSWHESFREKVEIFHVPVRFDTMHREHWRKTL